MTNILRGHFTNKPYPVDTRSIQERTRDQVQLATDLSFAKQYVRPPPYNAGAYTHRHTEPFFT